MTTDSAIFTLDVGGQSDGAVSAADAVAAALEHLNETMTQVSIASSASAQSLDQLAGGGEQVTKSHEHASESTDGFSKALGDAKGALADVSGEMGLVVNAGAEMVSKIGEAIGEEGGIGLLGMAGAAAVAVGALAELGEAGGALVTQISQVSAVTGLSTEETDYWGNALSDAGGSVNSLVMVNRLLTNSLQSVSDAQMTGNPLTQKQSDLLQALGGSAIGATGSTKSFAEAFPELITNLANMTDTADRAKIGTEIFGRSWGQVSLLIEHYNEISPEAKRQTDEMAAGMQDAGEKAVQYNTAMHNLGLEEERLALEVVPIFTQTLKGTNDLFSALPTLLERVPGPYQDISRALEGIKDPQEAAKKSILESIPFYNQAKDVLGLLGENTISAADYDKSLTDAQARAAASAGDLSASLTGLDAHLAGTGQALTESGILWSQSVQKEVEALGASYTAVQRDKEAKQEFAAANHLAADSQGNLLTPLQELTDKVGDSYNATIRDKTAKLDWAAANHLAADSVGNILPTMSELIGKEGDSYNATQRDKQAKLDFAAANHLAADSVGNVLPTMSELIGKQNDSYVSTQRDKDAKLAYATAHNLLHDSIGNLLPTMSDLIGKTEDSYNATLRDTEARKAAYAAMGLQSDREGNLIKSTKDMTDAVLDGIDAQRRQNDVTLQAYKSNFPSLVEAEKSSILAQDEMSKATDEANKELVAQGLIADTTAKSISDLATGWHQMTDAESQAAAKKPGSTSSGGATSGGATSGAAASSGGSVAYFSSGYGGGGGGGGTDVVPHAPSGPGTWIYNGAKGGWTSYSDPGVLNDPNLAYSAALGGYISYSDPGKNPLPSNSHVDGLDYVPYDNYPALLHKGERVMTAAENSQPQITEVHSHVYLDGREISHTVERTQARKQALAQRGM